MMMGCGCPGQCNAIPMPRTPKARANYSQGQCSCRTEGGEPITKERREEAQNKGDVLVKACLNYAKYVECAYFIGNPVKGDLKKRPIGVFIETSKIHDKTRDLRSPATLWYDLVTPGIPLGS